MPAKAAGVPFIALANKPDKHQMFDAAGCGDIIHGMDDLTIGGTKQAIDT